MLRLKVIIAYPVVTVLRFVFNFTEGRVSRSDKSIRIIYDLMLIDMNFLLRT